MTNQRTTREEYGYLGLQSIDNQEADEPFEQPGCSKPRHESFLKDRGARNRKKPVGASKSQSRTLTMRGFGLPHSPFY